MPLTFVCNCRSCSRRVTETRISVVSTYSACYVHAAKRIGRENLVWKNGTDGEGEKSDRAGCALALRFSTTAVWRLTYKSNPRGCCGTRHDGPTLCVSRTASLRILCHTGGIPPSKNEQDRFGSPTYIIYIYIIYIYIYTHIYTYMIVSFLEFRKRCRVLTVYTPRSFVYIRFDACQWRTKSSSPASRGGETKHGSSRTEPWDRDFLGKNDSENSTGEIREEKKKEGVEMENEAWNYFLKPQRVEGTQIVFTPVGCYEPALARYWPESQARCNTLRRVRSFDD